MCPVITLPVCVWTTTSGWAPPPPHSPARRACRAPRGGGGFPLLLLLAHMPHTSHRRWRPGCGQCWLQAWPGRRCLRGARWPRTSTSTRSLRMRRRSTMMRAWTTSSGPSLLLAVSPLLIAALPPPPQLICMHRRGTMVARLTPSSSPCLLLPGWVAWRAYVVRTGASCAHCSQLLMARTFRDYCTPPALTWPRRLDGGRKDSCCGYC